MAFDEDFLAGDKFGEGIFSRLSFSGDTFEEDFGAEIAWHCKEIVNLIEMPATNRASSILTISVIKTYIDEFPLGKFTERIHT